MAKKSKKLVGKMQILTLEFTIQGEKKHILKLPIPAFTTIKWADGVKMNTANGVTITGADLSEPIDQPDGVVFYDAPINPEPGANA